VFELRCVKQCTTRATTAALPLASPWSVITLFAPWTSEPLAVPHHSTLSVSSGSSFLPAPLFSSLPPAPLQSTKLLSTYQPCKHVDLPWPSRPTVSPCEFYLQLNLGLHPSPLHITPSDSWLHPGSSLHRFCHESGSSLLRLLLDFSNRRLPFGLLLTLLPSWTFPPIPSQTLPPIPSWTLPPIPSWTLPPIPSWTLPPIPSWTLPSIP